MRGWSLATRGDWEAGIVACQQALELAPDPYETAIVLGFLGHAHLEQGGLAEAIPVLKQAVQDAMQYRSRQVQCWFKTYLAEAYRQNGQIEEARDLTLQGFELGKEIKHWWGAGIAQCTLGRIAQSSGAHAEAASHFHDALQTFASIHAGFELGRTHLDLAALAHSQGDQDVIATHLNQAYAWFNKLQVPKYVERTEQLAHEYGLTLTEVPLEELTKEPS